MGTSDRSSLTDEIVDGGVVYSERSRNIRRQDRLLVDWLPSSSIVGWNNANGRDMEAMPIGSGRPVGSALRFAALAFGCRWSRLRGWISSASPQKEERGCDP
ncbi:hypothetical protein GCM10007880_60710 [Mesorhizobium amorphae]|nr:hypothetical protein GCM10007880_60710 [Mesorhizobium amorphae]